MTQPKQRLELTWIGKENRPRLEPRILLEDAAKSHHAARRVSENDLFDNHLIFGDNLLALKALEQEFTGKVKCIYIDPPFNTQQDFANYDDGMEHSRWLSFMKCRIEVLHRLLSRSGSLFVHIDDNELGYLIALVDDIFFRSNRISVISFKQSSASGPKATNPGLVSTTNYVLYYCKDKTSWRPNKVFVASKRDDRYTKFIENIDAPFSEWRLISLREAFSLHRRAPWDELRRALAEKIEPALEEFVLTHASQVIRTARVAPSDVNEQARNALELSLQTDERVFCSEREGKTPYYFLNGEQLIFYSTKARYLDGKLTTASPATNMWDDLHSNNLHKEGGVAFPNGKKPEALVKRVIELSTNTGDLVLDCFGGSGTTAAVAHKMQRRWITVEQGVHADTQILPRLTRVVDGTDSSGISKATGWKGGGGFRYFRLAPSLLELDRFGNHVISREYNPAMLAEAMCKLIGFTFSPSPELYWQQGYSTETDFLYTTTQTLSRQQLESLSEEVGPNRTLMVCCSAFRAKAIDFPNLTLRKIPMAVLARCEWGKDDYSLNIANLPQTPAPTEAEELLPESAHADRPPASPADARRRRTAAKQAANAGAGSLFDTVASEPEAQG